MILKLKSRVKNVRCKCISLHTLHSSSKSTSQALIPNSPVSEQMQTTNHRYASTSIYAHLFELLACPADITTKFSVHILTTLQLLFRHCHTYVWLQYSLCKICGYQPLASKGTVNISTQYLH